MKRWLTLLCLALVTGPLSAAVTLIEEGEVAVTMQQFRAALERLSPDERQAVSSDQQSVRAFAERLLVEQKMLREAESQGLDHEPRVVARLAELRQQLLLEVLIDRYLRDQSRPELEALAREHYLANPALFREPEQIRVAQIYLAVDDPAQHAAVRAKAEELRQQLQEGADFAELARRYSDDPNAAAGGEIEAWQVRGPGAHPVLEAAFALPEAGAISDVLEETAGFRILTLLERRDSRISPFEDVKDRLIPRLQREFQRQLQENYIHSFAPGEDAVVHEDLLRSLVR